MMQNSDFQAKFESGYEEFLLSEFLISIMENDNIAVEQLAKQVNLSPAVIQDICAGKPGETHLINKDD
ncbi:hypothetical protein VB713_05850 [Anabaena cylindrica UHCC 0172]|uniref:hypothetical protein n=1 Tax=Anabaena cylindrica TaxID=1165 RepID=UPI002B1FDED4|nr:hypothetical protein [Anabaena cylindrica]MEA5550505.1 hypothetical protein [Anabaena cylindrica UHCC 0172]